jgi:hypothetical protein
MLHSIATIVFGLFLQAVDQPLLGWQDFSPPGGGFTVKLPGEPKKNTQSVEIPAGTVKVTTYGIERDEMAFIIAVSEFPRGALKENAKEVLDEARDIGVQKSKGTQREEKEIELDDFPGREMVLDLPESRMRGSGIYLARIFLVGQTHFQVVTLSSKSNEKPNVRRAVLHSFKLKRDDMK